MTPIRFVGLAKPSEGTNKAKLEELTGFTLHRDGSDWLVRGDDPVLLKGPADVLITKEEPWELEPTCYKQIAREYSQGFLNPYFEKTLTAPKEKIPIYANCWYMFSMVFYGQAREKPRLPRHEMK
jgi:hypothetical protein